MLQRLGSTLGPPRLRVLLAVAGGATIAVAAASTVGLAAPGSPAQAQYAPRSSTAPTIGGTAQVGATLTANPGTWTGDQPVVFGFQWLRCNSGGNNCVTIGGATNQTYTAAEADRDNTLRVQVRAQNRDGSSTATSRATARVAAATGPAGAIRLANGETSIPATSVPATERLVIDRVSFTPSLVRSRTSPIRIVVKVKDTRGNVVRDAFVFLRSTPVVTRTPAETRTGQDGTVTFDVQPETDFPLRNGYAVQFFVRARKDGDRPLAGIAGYRLVQVDTAR
jgi:hypothetical protein